MVQESLLQQEIQIILQNHKMAKYGNINTDSTSYALDDIRVWGSLEYMPLTKNWVAVAQGAIWNTVELGATAFARVNVSSSRIQNFYNL